MIGGADGGTRRTALKSVFFLGVVVVVALSAEGFRSAAAAARAPEQAVLLLTTTKCFVLFALCTYPCFRTWTAPPFKCSPGMGKMLSFPASTDYANKHP